jgi:hypothetical protein
MLDISELVNSQFGEFVWSGMYHILTNRQPSHCGIASLDRLHASILHIQAW